MTDVDSLDTLGRGVRFAPPIVVDRDYLPYTHEDVAVRIPEELVDGGLDLTFDADQADAFADALKHHAAEVREINRLADERDARA